jgi:hypothetical protein
MDLMASVIAIYLVLYSMLLGVEGALVSMTSRWAWAEVDLAGLESDCFRSSLVEEGVEDLKEKQEISHQIQFVT